MAESRKSCELCGGEASVYCRSDSAFLCSECDEKVHCANFLVARHVRVWLVCPQCKTHVGNSVISSVEVSCSGDLKVVVCQSCSLKTKEGGDYCLSSSSSSCVSSTGEEAEVVSSSCSSVPRRKRINKIVAVDAKVEGILVNWCRCMGVEDSHSLVEMAIKLLSMTKTTIIPLRMSLATALWGAMRLCCGGSELQSTASTCQVLRRLEQVSGVPAKVMMATEHRLARVNKRRQSREDHVEGWAEC